MSGAVDVFGNLVSAQVRKNPHRARSLLTAAYEGVWASGALPRSGLPGVQARYVGHIAHVIARSLAHPERSVLVNVYFPHELLDAFGVKPLFPEGVAVYVANTSCSSVFAQIAEEQGVPESFCSYHKVMLGMAQAGVIGRPLMVANTTLACDANQVSFRAVAEALKAPQIVVDVPHEGGPDAVDYVESQLFEVAAMLEDVTHSSLRSDALRQAMVRSRNTMESMKRYWALRGSASLPTTITSVFCDIVATHCLSSDAESARFMRSMEHLASRPSAQLGQRDNGKPRIFWVHTLPNWQMSMRQVFDGAANAEVVGTDMGWDSELQADPSDPFHSMAQRIVGNMSNGDGMRRVEHAVRLAKQARADGAIVFCHWGCKQTLGLSQLMKEAFEAEGIAALVLDGDGCDPRNVADGQMVTRVGAFIEQLEGSCHE